jgi:hypothetical protein
MSTIEIEATELQDADVQFVSLVDRGANRIPFRIIKSQSKETQTMTQKHQQPRDLYNLAHLFKRDQRPATVAKPIPAPVSKAAAPAKPIPAPAPAPAPVAKAAAPAPAKPEMVSISKAAFDAMQVELATLRKSAEAQQFSF